MLNASFSFYVSPLKHVLTQNFFQYISWSILVVEGRKILRNTIKLGHLPNAVLILSYTWTAVLTGLIRQLHFKNWSSLWLEEKSPQGKKCLWILSSFSLSHSWKVLEEKQNWLRALEWNTFFGAVFVCTFSWKKI